MSKKFSIDADAISRLEQTHERVRASMTPEQLSVAEQVDAAFNNEVEDMERRSDVENRLRAWSESLCGVPLDISEIEEFRNSVQRMTAGTMFNFYPKRGKGRAVMLYKTAFGTIDQVERYLNTLERTVIDVTNNSQFTALPFSGLMKLAFKRLINRSK